MSYECFAPNGIKNTYLEVPTSIKQITLEDIRILLYKYDIQYPEIVLAQIRLETGNLSSRLCKSNKNLLGMKYPKKRDTTAVGEQFGHAKYKTYSDCIADYALWQKARYKGGDYYTFLKDIGYAQDELYISKLQQISGVIS